MSIDTEEWQKIHEAFNQLVGMVEDAMRPPPDAPPVPFDQIPTAQRAPGDRLWRALPRYVEERGPTGKVVQTGGVIIKLAPGKALIGWANREPRWIPLPNLRLVSPPKWR